MAFVELIDVVKRFGRHAAVESFTLDVEEGEFVSFLGGSGCGKTTTLRMIAGFETPTAGSILIDGADVVRRCRPTGAASAWSSRTTPSFRT